ncbi:hypothetical protein GWI33_006457 [Rhynchophorus ferrugineus]|uniref:Fibronectin type-III domain-containing protein n=1 Tax=Rhynchophorus ferrugineus TaxID=354439 RepID=A0A834IHL0_RHYFE|nr:hypothetical protein GWI33_006457 [Rhynchophorus ferrugineus]
MRGRTLEIIVSVKLLVFCLVTSSEVFTRIKREQHKIQGVCVEKGSEPYDAIGWIYPLKDSENEETKTKYLPDIQNQYNCNFNSPNGCSVKWRMQNWYIDNNSSKTTEFSGDSRWDDIPTIMLNEAHNISGPFPISVGHKNGISIRSSEPVGISLCPKTSQSSDPCYNINISKYQIKLYKFTTWQDKSSFAKNHLPLQSYKGTRRTEIISENEWRNFEVSFNENGNIRFVDKHLGKIFIEYADKDFGNFSTMLATLHSEGKSAWKIIKNEFMYTNRAMISNMGPRLILPYKDLCISLYVATCNNCEMLFFYKYGRSKNILKHVKSTNENWVEIKIKEADMSVFNLDLLVETKFVNGTNSTEGWWAIDDVRVCHENEIKVNQLKLTSIQNDQEVTNNTYCHVIGKRSLRPEIPSLCDKMKSSPQINIETRATYIKLSWPQEDPYNLTTYTLSYQGIDECNLDMRRSERSRSSGFLTSNQSEFIIKDLVPKTKYHITISSLLCWKNKDISEETLESDEPYIDELPFKMKIQTTFTTADLTWNTPSCNSRKGGLVYTLTLSIPGSNIITEKIENRTNNTYKFTDLKPSTIYTVRIWSARTVQKLKAINQRNMLEFNFTTPSEVIPLVENAEIYAIGSNIAYVRYELPLWAIEAKAEIRASLCMVNSLARCRESVLEPEPCALWKNKYCLSVYNLVNSRIYNISLEIKDKWSDRFGEKKTLIAYTEDKVPEPAQNVSYEIIPGEQDPTHCTLHINWQIPYFPNGIINTFNIFLSSATEEIVWSYEVPKMLPIIYSHQVPNINCDDKYILTIQSANAGYNKNYTTVVFQKKNIQDYLIRKPELVFNNEDSLVLQPPIFNQTLDSTIYVIVQDTDTTGKDASLQQLHIINEQIINVKKLCLPFGRPIMLLLFKVVNSGSSGDIFLNKSVENLFKTSTFYCVTYIIKSHYHGQELELTEYQILTIPRKPVTHTSNSSPINTQNQSLSEPIKWKFYSFNRWWLILLIIPFSFTLFFLIRFIIASETKRREQKKTYQKKEEPEHVYESILYYEQCSNSKLYDKLFHE